MVIVADALYDSQSKAVAFLALRAVEAGENVILIKGWVGGRIGDGQAVVVDDGPAALSCR